MKTIIHFQTQVHNKNYTKYKQKIHSKVKTKNKISKTCLKTRNLDIISLEWKEELKVKLQSF